MASPRSANIKIILILIAVLIVVGTLMYTRLLVGELLQKERDVADLYARSLQFIANSTGDQSDYSFIFEEVIRSIDFPMILSDPEGNPMTPFHSTSRNIAIDTTMGEKEQEEFLRETIARLDAHNLPIMISVQGKVVQYVHYGESELITKLRWLPYVEIAVAGMFIILGYIGFSYIKRHEQSNLWVGMSKETAHQLGTPLSSLMGWVELLKEEAADRPSLLTTIAEMESDVSRLQIVTDRFSKIGSKPILREENIFEAISGVIEYFRRRLPTRFGDGKQFDISFATSAQPSAKINRELFGWVIENLIKNALDSMESGKGKITFTLETVDDSVLIDVADTGKGIDLKSKQDIFRPGYSTKVRGWGLGLSLSKRIIESYHGGKIFVKESRVGKGTTFRIKLRV